MMSAVKGSIGLCAKLVEHSFKFGYPFSDLVASRLPNCVTFISYTETKRTNIDIVNSIYKLLCEGD